MRIFSVATLALAGIGLTAALNSCAVSKEKPAESISRVQPMQDAHDGWKLGIQAYALRAYSFFESVDKAASLGLRYIEAYPGQQLSKERPEMQMVHTIPEDIRQEVKQKLAGAGINLVNYGVVDLPNDEVECRKVFDFAKEMGIETIVSEPPEEAFLLIDRLCQEYQIKMAIHNHPQPSRYWNPETVARVLQGRSQWLGAGGDIGHWARSGLVPVEVVQKLAGRHLSFHIKDVVEFGVPEAGDALFGQGKVGMKDVLTELHRQNFKGPLIIEYEDHPDDNLTEIGKSIDYYNQVASQLQTSM
ncbi:MAG: sugar phosphate isomerase/epimerase [Fidelibacterota bacterium]|nr:MAG: sugar phosphate isomerase/epimerase [Candidatus Neomarinimicrobiota bacterium]